LILFEFSIPGTGWRIDIVPLSPLPEEKVA